MKLFPMFVCVCVHCIYCTLYNNKYRLPLALARLQWLFNGKMCFTYWSLWALMNFFSVLPCITDSVSLRTAMRTKETQNNNNRRCWHAVTDRSVYLCRFAIVWCMPDEIFIHTCVRARTAECGHIRTTHIRKTQCKLTLQTKANMLLQMTRSTLELCTSVVWLASLLTPLRSCGVSVGCQSIQHVYDVTGVRQQALPHAANKSAQGQVCFVRRAFVDVWACLLAFVQMQIFARLFGGSVNIWLLDKFRIRDLSSKVSERNVLGLYAESCKGQWLRCAF